MRFKLRSASKKGRQSRIQDASEILLLVILSPVLIPAILFAALKWLFTLRYPLTSEGAKLLITERYLKDCQKYRKQEKKAEVFKEVCSN